MKFIVQILTKIFSFVDIQLALLFAYLQYGKMRHRNPKPVKRGIRTGISYLRGDNSLQIFDEKS